MEELALTVSLATMFMIAMICTIVFKKLKMPAIIGYLATGIILANYWHSSESESMETIINLLASIGLALLMFAIGMELNFEKLKKNGTFAVLIVLVQVPIVIIAGMIFGNLMGWDFTLSIALGAILSGSSTAVVLVVQNERNVLSREEVDTLLLILVVEDVAQVILLSILTPMMETASTSMNMMDIVILLAKIIIFMVASVFIGIRLVPKILNWIGKNMVSEVLIISALGFCFLLSALAVGAGMSMAVGAFLMGVIVSQCEKCHEIEHNIEPMKDIFMSMFFIEVGLSVNPNDLIQNIPLIIAILLLFFISRTVAIYLGYFLGNKDMRIGFISATSLLTMGEFAFIISSMAYKCGIMNSSVHAAIIGAALVSMVTQSFITGASGKMFDGINGHLPGFLKRFNAKMMEHRVRMYDYTGKLSESTVKRSKKLLAFAYCSGIVVAVILVVFYLEGDFFISQLDSLTPSQLTYHECGLIVRLAEFLILLIPISMLVSNIKNIGKRIIGEGKDKGLEDAQQSYLRRSTSINLWIYTFLVDFILLLIIPCQMNLLTQILIAAVGIAIFALVWVFKYKRSLKPVKEEE